MARKVPTPKPTLRPSQAERGRSHSAWLTLRQMVALLLVSVLLLVAAVWIQGEAGAVLDCTVIAALVLLCVCLFQYQRGLNLAGLGEATEEHALVFSAIEHLPESMVMVDREGRLLYANRTFLERSGYTLAEVRGSLSREVSATGMSEMQRAQMREVVQAGHVWRGILVNRRKDGSEMQEGVSISPLLDHEGQISGFVELKQDMTELLQARERVNQLLNFDAVTLLPNRLALSQHLEGLIGSDEGYPNVPEIWHALLLMDMDHFSKFNTGRGIEWGDALLRAVAGQVQSLLPPTAWLARTTGDEFAIVLSEAGTSRADARMMAYALATRLQQGLAQVEVVRQSAELVPVSFCVGLTVFPFTEPMRKRDSEDHVYRRATMALYQAKSQGAGKLHAFSEALEENTQRKLAIELGLYEALEQQHLRLYVQEQVDIEGNVCGVEALVRWQPPGQPLVVPGTFIPVAEESDLIVKVGDWVLQQAVALLSHPLVKNSPMWVSVNISARQFAQPDFVDKVAALLSETKLGPNRLNMEVTESMVLENVDEAIQTMARLNAMGVQCALDDFGTGYSSLSYLHRLPIQEIKIDQSFIYNLDPDAKSGALLQALLMVAKSMQLRVVAEGVEEMHQADLLRAWYPAILCQGYLFSRPMPAHEWLEKLARQALVRS